jgi:signal transduction histidine kinase
MSSARELHPDPQLMAALAEFAAGAGHEINNPLASIIGRAQQLAADEADPVRQQMLAVIVAQAWRVRDMIGDVMAFGRPPQPQLQPMDLVALITGVCNRWQGRGSAPGITIPVSGPSRLDVELDPVQWTIVIEELLRNAEQAAAPEAADIQIRIEAAAGQWSLEVLDHGRGFTELEQQHAFNPFFSGRQAGRGLGFGLCKVWQIVRLHGGAIRISSSQGLTTVRIVMPTASALSDADEIPRQD